MIRDFSWVFAEGLLSRFKLEHDTGETLGQRIMNLSGHAVPFSQHCRLPGLFEQRLLGFYGLSIELGIFDRRSDVVSQALKDRLLPGTVGVNLAATQAQCAKDGSLMEKRHH